LKNLWNLKKDGSIDLLNETYTQKNQDNKNYTNSEVSINKTFKVASVTIANGGDNIGVYAPLFASMSIYSLTLTIIIFIIMIGLWCITGYFMVSNHIVGYKLQKYGHIILPFVLIFIGMGILSGGL
jgi:cadmium resistance protein CadD (predicted permease)